MRYKPRRKEKQIKKKIKSTVSVGKKVDGLQIWIIIRQTNEDRVVMICRKCTCLGQWLLYVWNKISAKMVAHWSSVRLSVSCFMSALCLLNQWKEIEEKYINWQESIYRRECFTNLFLVSCFSKMTMREAVQIPHGAFFLVYIYTRYMIYCR